MAEKDQVTQAVDFGVGAEHVDSFLDVASGECCARIRQHLFEHRCHVGEVTNVLRIKARADGLRAAGKAEQKVANTLQADHELHAGQQFARFGFGDPSDDLGHARIYFHVQAVKFFLAFTERIQQRGGCGGNTLRGGRGCILRYPASLDRALHQLRVVGFRFGASQNRGTHARIPSGSDPGQPREALARSRLAAIDGQYKKIGCFFKGLVNRT